MPRVVCCLAIRAAVPNRSAQGSPAASAAEQFVVQGLPARPAQQPAPPDEAGAYDALGSRRRTNVQEVLGGAFGVMLDELKGAAGLIRLTHEREHDLPVVRGVEPHGCAEACAVRAGETGVGAFEGCVVGHS